MQDRQRGRPQGAVQIHPAGRASRQHVGRCGNEVAINMRWMAYENPAKEPWPSPRFDGLQGIIREASMALIIVNSWRVFESQSQPNAATLELLCARVGGEKHAGFLPPGRHNRNCRPAARLDEGKSGVPFTTLMIPPMKYVPPCFCIAPFQRFPAVPFRFTECRPVRKIVGSSTALVAKIGRRAYTRK